MPEIWDKLQEMLNSLHRELANENALYGYSSPYKEKLNMLITLIEAILILHKQEEKQC